MVHRVAMLVNDEDGDEVERGSRKWCLLDETGGHALALHCDGQVIGYGEGAAVYEEKTVSRGGITCRDCVKKLKAYKAIKL